MPYNTLTLASHGYIQVASTAAIVDSVVVIGGETYHGNISGVSGGGVGMRSDITSGRTVPQRASGSTKGLKGSGGTKRSKGRGRVC